MKKLYKTKLGVLLVLLLLGLSGSTQTITIGTGAEINIVGHNNANPTYTTTVDCDGTIDVYGILDLDNNATLKVGGDFVSNTAGTNIQRGNATVIMDGSSAQEIKGGSSIVTTTSFGFYNLTINNAAGVTINIAKIATFTVYSVLNPILGTLTTNNALLLDALSTTNYSRINYGAGLITGNVLIEKQLSNSSASWRQLSMPITSTLATANWNGITLLKSDHSPSNQINTFTYNATSSGASDYAFGIEQAAPIDNQTEAYMIYSNNTNGIHSINTGITVKGPLNQGNFLNALQFTRDPANNPATGNEAKGWNFIPNPWAALVNSNALITDATNFTPAYKAIHVWDVFSQGYSAVLGNGITKIIYGATGSDYLASNTNLAPFQAFWVKADAANQVCNLIASTMQTADYAGNVVFMKANPETIRLDVFDQDSLRDQLVLYFDENLSSDFDLAGDAYYLPSQNKSVPIFYAEEDGSRASIVGRSAELADSVQVVFGSSKEQSKFYIHADLDELEEGWFVYLRDKKDNKTYQLQHNKSILFSHFNGLKSERFVVYYSKNEHAFSQLVLGEEGNIVFYVANGVINLQSVGVSGNAQINLFDAVGRLLYTEKQQIQLGERTQVDFSSNLQFIIVEVLVNGKTYRDKVYF